ncbi:MAG TPA: 30S ribosome-binding factor RbfA [Burkholderiales bacterium]|nr:30S ribosome-binding factor RbfA [Burkholderiales bacterium]
MAKNTPRPRRAEQPAFGASHSRPRRVGSQIQRELAEILREELKDPGVGMITITGVDLSPDFAHAKVFFTRLEGNRELPLTIGALKRASGFLRSQLAHRLRLRSVPELHFVYDSSVEAGDRVSRLIDEAVAGESRSA